MKQPNDAKVKAPQSDLNISFPCTAVFSFWSRPIRTHVPFSHPLVTDAALELDAPLFIFTSTNSVVRQVKIIFGSMILTLSKSEK